MEHKPKLSPDSKDKIGKNLIKFNPYAQSSKSGSERYWLNLKIKDSWDTFEKTISRFSEEDNKVNSVSQNIIYNNFEPVPAVLDKSVESVVEKPPKNYIKKCKK